eukprot:Gregarina_sp_Poly_1__188@NODE_1043_length_5264_cov_29_231672_g723_i0_p8_GENE_NODE_1043_length_5264_cov_29_231672_g723_i0NODE_1043_length_5264_cov_29_231672_g723_i0_p8_ORF_typecomplete_len123_score27_71FH2/PF02181_23/2_4e08FH2/PF02181_23/2e03_NODE_1043_length_5264_cov_29_231672_g723_i042534621
MASTSQTSIHALSPFFSAAKPQIEICARMIRDAKAECTKTMKYFGETEQTMAKVPPQMFFKLVTTFAAGFEQERKLKLEKMARERKRQAKLKSAASDVSKTTAKGPDEKMTPRMVKLRTADD